MILDKDYDNALWYMLLAKDRNATELLAFLKSLPEGLLDIIKNNIQSLKDGNYVAEEHYYTDPKDPTIHYYYELEPSTGALTINKSKLKLKSDDDEFVDDEDFDEEENETDSIDFVDDEDFDEVEDEAELFEFVLFPMSKDESTSLNYGEAMWYASIRNFREEEYYYHLERTLENYQSVCARTLFLDSNHNLPGVTPVDLNNIPEDLTFENAPQRTLKQ